MSLAHSPRIVTDGLVLCLDAGNTKSYPGYWSPTLSNGANAFDGSLSTAAGILGGTTGPFTYTFAHPPAINSARMFVTFGSSSNQVGGATNIFLVNGIDVTQKAKDANVFGDGVGSAWIDVTTEAGSNWNTFQFRTIAFVTNAGIYAIEINGKIIVGNYNGTTWTDLSGNGNNGTLENGVGYNSSNGGSLSFDGVDENATVGSSVLTTGETSISMWVKPDSNQTSGLGDLNVGGGGLLLYQIGTIIMMGFRGGTPEIRTTTQFITSNVWNHITWVYNNGSKSSTSSFQIYLNSEIEPTLTTSGAIFGGTVFNRIGSDQNAPYFDGNIAQVSIYNKALTASEVQQNFNATKSRF